MRDTVMHGGHWGGVRRTCWPPTDDEPLRYEFGALLLEFSVDFSLDQRQTQWRKLILAAHPGSYKHHQYNLADHQSGTSTLRGIRYTQTTCSQGGGPCGGFETR